MGGQAELGHHVRRKQTQKESYWKWFGESGNSSKNQKYVCSMKWEARPNWVATSEESRHKRSLKEEKREATNLFFFDIYRGISMSLPSQAHGLFSLFSWTVHFDLAQRKFFFLVRPINWLESITWTSFRDVCRLQIDIPQKMLEQGWNFFSP